MDAKTIKWIIKGFELLLNDKDYFTYNGEEIKECKQNFLNYLSKTIGEQGE